MQWRPNQIALVKEVREKTGLGLREAYDLTNQYPNKTADELAEIAKASVKATSDESVNPADLTAEEKAVIAALRARGFAVAVFNPDELRGIDPDKIAGIMVERGNIAIDALATARNNPAFY